MKHLYLYALVLVTVMGCKSKNNGVTIDDILNDSQAEKQLDISEESINQIIQSIPSPLEIATLIKESGAPFDQDITNSTDNREKYLTEYDQALAMGIYAGDLGYINIYEKGHLALSYLQAVNKLADDLSVGQFFDFETIKRLASNADKIDSLLYLSTMNFERMDQFLRSQKRSNLSVLLVTGTWIESMYIAANVAITSKSSDLYDRIGEQKLVLNQVLLIVSAYKHIPFFSDLNDRLMTLKDAYADISVKYIYREPETIEQDGKLVIVDRSETVIVVTPEEVAHISEVLTELRNQVTGSAS